MDLLEQNTPATFEELLNTAAHDLSMAHEWGADSTLTLVALHSAVRRITRAIELTEEVDSGNQDR